MNEPDAKKLIIDEDWKSQVEAEKEAIKTEKPEPGQAPGQEPRGATMPPASFAMLITTLATEAMVWLGQIPHPAAGKVVVELDQAKYFIDTLRVLEDKTKGNLTPDEKRELDEVLHQLRLAYVAAQKRQAAEQMGENETPNA